MTHAEPPRISAQLVFGLLGCLALGACSFGGPQPGSSQARADADTVAACRQQAEQIYEEQNRGAIYSPAPAVNTPASSNYVPGTTDRGLSDLYARQTMINDCVRNLGTRTSRGVSPGLRNTP